MEHHPIASSIIELKQYVPAHLFHEFGPHLGTLEFGRKVYQQLPLSNVDDDAGSLLLKVSEEWLNYRWDLVHDGYQYVALQQPLACILSEDQPPRPLERGPLRILLTIAPLDNDSITDDLLLEDFSERLNRLIPNREHAGIDLTVEYDVSARTLFQVIQTAQMNDHLFHIWHHVGRVNASLSGPELELNDGYLKCEVLKSLMDRIAGKTARPGLRLFLLHTPSSGSALMKSLARLSAPTLIGLTIGAHSQLLLRGLYLRLLSHDIATAVLLARLDSYIDNPTGSEWMDLQMLSRPRPLQIVTQAWSRQVIARRELPDSPRLLFLRANPADAKHGLLQLDGEIKFIKKAMAYRRGEFEMRDEGALELEEFSQYLLEMNPDLIHFSGHGSTRGSLLWETSEGLKTFVQPERIVGVITQFETIRCIVLNACYSSKFAELLHPHGIVVIGMGDAVTNDAAIHFARKFYQVLAHGESLARAFDQACAELKLLGMVDDLSIPQISDYEQAARIRLFSKEEM